MDKLNGIRVPDLNLGLQCANIARHTKNQPEDYLHWHCWAEKKSKTHKQVQCPMCKLWVIWHPKS